MAITPRYVACSLAMRDDSPLAKRLQRHWYAADGASDALLRPLGGLFSGVARLRRAGYRQGLLNSERLPVPVLVVGNITVGGTGKTPLVVALVEWLREQGWRPGVISRGYGSEDGPRPLLIDDATSARLAGDEPALIARRCGCPVAIDPQRARAGQLLVAEAGVDILVTDDGLQHYALARDIEIAVIDASRGLGNRALLPAGPLREPPERLRSVDFVVSNGGPWQEQDISAWPMQLQTLPPVTLAGVLRQWDAWQGQTVHAVAGIGNPQRFFDALTARGLQVIAHPFPDHHQYKVSDLLFGDEHPVLMTEKDAVKCQGLALPRLWFVPVTAVLPREFYERLGERLSPMGAAAG